MKSQYQSVCSFATHTLSVLLVSIEGFPTVSFLGARLRQRRASVRREREPLRLPQSQIKIRSIIVIDSIVRVVKLSHKVGVAGNYIPSNRQIGATEVLNLKRL